MKATKEQSPSPQEYPTQTQQGFLDTPRAFERPVSFSPSVSGGIFEEEMAPCLSAPPLRANWGLRPTDTLLGGRMRLQWGPQYRAPAGTAQEKGVGGAPPGQSCSASPTRWSGGRRERAGLALLPRFFKAFFADTRAHSR